jgi:hypothetical protein
VISHATHLQSTRSHLRRLRRLLGAAVALAGLLVACIASAPAHAALFSTTPCNEESETHPFAPWGDTSSYELAKGGDFEGPLPGWTLSGGATVTSGSEPFAATGWVGRSSLVLPPGAVAESPFSCANAAYPTFRFFARNYGAAATVAVQVVYRTPLATTAAPLGVVALTGSWSPSAVMLTGAAVPGALSGGTGKIALRFTALTGSSQIDDVFIDPRMR